MFGDLDGLVWIEIVPSDEAHVDHTQDSKIKSIHDNFNQVKSWENFMK